MDSDKTKIKSRKTVPFVGPVAGLYLVIISLMTLFNGESCHAQFSTVNQSQTQSLDVYSGQHLVTTFQIRSGNKPILWPLMSPKGHRLTRDYPMVDSTDEVRDHIHHRSLWLTYGEVNQVDFWAEEGKNLGHVLCQGFESIHCSDQFAKIITSSNWADSNDKTLLHERRITTISTFESAYVIDIECHLSALEETIDWGDTKEGTLGLRVSDLIRVDSKQGGRILDSLGRKNEAAWGQQSEWVDYSGPTQKTEPSNNDQSNSSPSDVQDAGITLFYHPQSFRYPGRWHVRGYGLFAHNPFGIKDFPVLSSLSSLPSSESPESPINLSSSKGGYQMKPHESIQLRYAVLLHDSDWTPELANRFWKAFAKENKLVEAKIVE